MVVFHSCILVYSYHVEFSEFYPQKRSTAHRGFYVITIANFNYFRFSAFEHEVVRFQCCISSKEACSN